MVSFNTSTEGSSVFSSIVISSGSTFSCVFSISELIFSIFSTTSSEVSVSVFVSIVTTSSIVVSTIFSFSLSLLEEVFAEQPTKPITRDKDKNNTTFLIIMTSFTIL